MAVAETLDWDSVPFNTQREICALEMEWTELEDIHDNGTYVKRIAEIKTELDVLMKPYMVI